MNLNLTMRSLLLLLLTTLGLSAAETPSKVFRAGAATSNITPDIGGDIIGGFNPFPSTHIHDELHVRCLVLDNGEKKIAFAVCDFLGGSRDMFEEAARLVKETTGIPRECLVMSGTHTHSASSAMGSDRLRMPQPPLDPYQKFVARRIADGVTRAANNLVPARIGWAVGSEPNQVFCRRWIMKPGTAPVNPFGKVDTVKMNPGYGPNLVQPSGPIDPDVSVLSVQTADGKPLAVLANYSLHYVGDVGPGHVSADYFGAFCDRLQQLVGADRQEPPFVAILSNGTSGNINNNDYSKPPSPRGPLYSKIRKVADDVAQAAMKAMQRIEYQTWIPLDARYRDLEVGTRRVSDELLQWAKERTAKPRALNEKGTLEVIYAERTLRMAEYPPTIKVPIQALRIGGCGIATSPFETFTETGLELKARSPFKPSFTIELAGGYYGYLPTPEQHLLGGYETWIGTNRVEEQTSVKLADALVEMWEEMK
jgi:hypothetical protein